LFFNIGIGKKGKFLNFFGRYFVGPGLFSEKKKKKNKRGPGGPKKNPCLKVPFPKRRGGFLKRGGHKFGGEKTQKPLSVLGVFFPKGFWGGGAFYLFFLKNGNLCFFFCKNFPAPKKKKFF